MNGLQQFDWSDGEDDGFEVMGNFVIPQFVPMNYAAPVFMYLNDGEHSGGVQVDPFAISKDTDFCLTDELGGTNLNGPLMKKQKVNGKNPHCGVYIKTKSKKGKVTYH